MIVLRKEYEVCKTIIMKKTGSDADLLQNKITMWAISKLNRNWNDYYLDSLLEDANFWELIMQFF